MPESDAQLQVTKVQVFPLPVAEGKLKAFARVTLNDQLQLTSLRVYDGTKGLFVSYPHEPGTEADQYRQLFYPIKRELRDHIEQMILEEYRKLMDP